MKYIITETKINSTIRNFIMESFPMVGDVKYMTQTLVLGSTEGQPRINQTIIRVIFDNKDNEYSRGDLIEIKKQIIDKVDGVFGLDTKEYGSAWGWDFRQVALVSLDATLTNVKK
jgi:hypothetical protein